MDKTYHGLIDALLRLKAPDMTRLRDMPQADGEEWFSTFDSGGDLVTDYRCPCYSETALAEIFGHEDAAMICRAFDGEPIWPDVLRRYLYGMVDGRATAS